MKRKHLREIRKEYPDIPDCCQRCQLFLHTEDYREGSARMDALDSKVMVIYDTPEQVEGTACASVQCRFPDQLRTKTGKIPSTYIQLCSSFVKEDIESVNPDILATYGEAAKESIKYLGLDSKIDTCHLLTTTGERNKPAYNRVQYYKTHDTFLKPEYSPMEDMLSYINNTPNIRVGIDFEWKPTGS